MREPDDLVVVAKPWKRVFVFALVFLVVGIVPVFLHSQWITGPLVNAALLIAAVLVGPADAIMLGLIPSTVALSSGLLPLPLAPMIPFIMIGNGLYIILFLKAEKFSRMGAVIMASLGKFLFLFVTSKFILSALLSSPLAEKVSIMMSWPQLMTALIGGVIALSFFELSRRHGNK